MAKKLPTRPIKSKKALQNNQNYAISHFINSHKNSLLEGRKIAHVWGVLRPLTVCRGLVFLPSQLFVRAKIGYWYVRELLH